MSKIENLGETISFIRGNLTNLSSERHIIYNYFVLQKSLIDFNTGLKLTVTSEPIKISLLNKEGYILCDGDSIDFILGFLDGICQSEKVKNYV